MCAWPSQQRRDGRIGGCSDATTMGRAGRAAWAWAGQDEARTEQHSTAQRSTAQDEGQTTRGGLSASPAAVGEHDGGAGAHGARTLHARITSESRITIYRQPRSRPVSRCAFAQRASSNVLTKAHVLLHSTLAAPEHGLGQLGNPMHTPSLHRHTADMLTVSSPARYAYPSVSHHAGTWRCNASTSRNGEHTAQVRHGNEIWKATCTCILLRPPLSGYVAALVPACSSCCCCMHTHIGAAEQRCSDHFFLVSDAHDNIPPHLLCPILVSLAMNMQLPLHRASCSFCIHPGLSSRLRVRQIPLLLYPVRHETQDVY